MANAAPKKKPMKSHRSGKKTKKRIDQNHQILRNFVSPIQNIVDKSGV